MEIIYPEEEGGTTYHRLADTFSCLSAMKDSSGPLGFDPESTDSNCRSLMVKSSVSSYESVKSDRSKDFPLNFRAESEPFKKKKMGVYEQEQLSCCPLCQDIFKDPVSTSCGHWLCKQCITSYWDQSVQSRLCSCPQCAEIFRTKEGLQTFNQNITAESNVGLQELLYGHQISLKRKYENVTEEINEKGRETPLKKIYTELFITEGLREEVHTQHEVKQLETTTKIIFDNPIKSQDIFKVLVDQHGSIRVVLTIGVAGIGKTFSVQKFTLDWAEGLENQDISAVIPLSFREMNLIRDEQHSLLTLIQVFYPTFQKITAEQLSVCKLLFIFDGLDESRLSLDFNNSQVVSDVTQKSSINVLLTNLIQGHLLPSALVWITSRPAATNQIPPSCVSRLTEVRGFTDSQTEEYFRRRFSDEDLSSRIISHIKVSKSLLIMCRVPVFCWITAVVLEHMLTTERIGDLPTTMTDLYSHFLMVQTKRKKNKYQQEQDLTEADMEVLLKLGRLAFEHLEKGNIMFYQEDLEQCGLDVTEASLYSGVCTTIFRRECEIFQKPVYCFVHLSVQEFLAAVYMIHCYNNKTVMKKNFLEDQIITLPLDEFLHRVMTMSVRSKTGHLDLFVRFLHGLSVESNQKLLGNLLGWTEYSPETILKAINNLKKMNSENMCLDRTINIFHCLTEMRDVTVYQEIQEFLKSENRSKKQLSVINCTALAYMLQMSKDVLEELDLKHYNTVEEGRWRLIAAVNNCKKFRLSGLMKSSEEGPSRLSARELSQTDCEVLALALKSSPSHLTELDLSWNQIKDIAAKALSVGLKNPNCKLKTLRLKGCSLSHSCCAVLGTALKSNPSHLMELDLSYNMVQDLGLKHLCGFLESPDCKLRTLRLMDCRLSEISCEDLVLALKSNPSHLTELDLGMNKLQDLGVKSLCGFLRSPDCRLKTLGLNSCGLSKISCDYLVSALESNPSHLSELDLVYNYLQDSDVQQISALKKSPDSKLETVKWKPSLEKAEDVEDLSVWMELS